MNAFSLKKAFIGSRSYVFCIFLAGLLFTWSGTGNAEMFSGTSGPLAASANFQLSGNTLTITLTNTSTADVLVPTDVLTGIFFNTTHTLTPVSASLNGSTVYYASLTNVGDGWGYASGVSANGMNSAISSTGAVSGLGHSNFSAASNALDGLAYGILSAGDNSATGNSGVTGSGPLIKNSVQFTLTAASGFSLSELGNSVLFQYGTALTDPYYTGSAAPVPVPPSALLLAPGLFGLVALRKRFKKPKV